MIQLANMITSETEYIITTIVKDGIRLADAEFPTRKY